jgi:antitoxin (DNA-binding transcriptional repressor) of toxin-antitoxin stability system
MTSMQSVSATEFKAKCLDMLDHIPADGLQITKRGKPVAVVTRPQESNADLIGSAPYIEIYGDIFSTGLKWDAES